MQKLPPDVARCPGSIADVIALEHAASDEAHVTGLPLVHCQQYVRRNAALVTTSQGLNIMSNVSTIYANEPHLLERLKIAGEAARAARGTDKYEARISEIDSITDELASRWLCRPRSATSMLSDERARLGFKGL